MSSSGLIYAVIVGAWAAYLVPMWLRRQDELNDSRPTERFSTAIRLLSGRAAMERRHAREREAREEALEPAADGDDPGRVHAADEAVHARDLGDPASGSPGVAEPSAVPVLSPQPAPVSASGSRKVPASVSVDAEALTELHHRPPQASKERGKRAKVLARRRRTTMVLFLAFTFGAVIAAVGGLRLLWAPGIPAILLSAYIVYLRAQERRRFAVRLDNQRAESAARRLHERRRDARAGADAAAPEPDHRPAPVATPADDRRVLVEQTDHAEWVDQQRGRDPQGDGWDPVPVPLPTYVNAPVAPRSAAGVDLGAADAWSSARSTSADPPAPPAPSAAEPRRQPRRGRQRARTPLFDQNAEQERRRAANE
ncbi:hypothetical protein QNO07_24620 [Streptomyces sp. 549]|uniref:divisome protein SepX/GlpR n=1 Tax=Streptomyces sp. 549 TaxID=3049076 RepID=UPI0024C3E6D2|nr:gephyrin-like molybdotransferase receptor GlpR [Streptomyces sp. 549]MDK1476549.1 hypothetical protein [Streptomyces sp. 549]